MNIPLKVSLRSDPRVVSQRIRRIVRQVSVGGKFIKARLKTAFENSQPIAESPLSHCSRRWERRRRRRSPGRILAAGQRPPQDLRLFNFMVFHGPVGDEAGPVSLKAEFSRKTQLQNLTDLWTLRFHRSLRLV